MKILMQRVRSAELRASLGPQPTPLHTASIGCGLLLYVSVGAEDANLAKVKLGELGTKILHAKVFTESFLPSADPAQIVGASSSRLAYSLCDVKGDLLVVSQITLYGDLGKGRRPSFDASAKPSVASSVYEDFLAWLKHSEHAAGGKVETGLFGAHMDIHAQLDGPVTFLLKC